MTSMAGWGLLLLVGAVRAGGRSREVRERPNVVMLFVDDLGYGDVGFNGHPSTLTPEIDALAWNGKVLTTWYSACPVCSCSRASLMTGRQWSRMGIPGVFSATTASGLPLNETTVAEQLSAAGYATGAVGKWHLGQRASYLPAARGFDQYLGIPYSDVRCDMGEARARRCDRSGMRAAPGKRADDVLAPYVEAGLASPPSDQERGDPAGSFLPLLSQKRRADGSVKTTVVEQPLELSTLSQKYADFATAFIREHAHRPFFLYVPFSHVHTTAANQPEKQYCGCDFKNATRRGAFGDALAEVDWTVGQIVKALKTHGVDKNTLVLFSGDNGPWLKEGTSGGSTGLLSGRFAGYWNVGKGSTWEGGIREAGFAWWPGVVSSMDLFPTALDLAGVPLPTDREFDGKSMLPILLHDQPSAHEMLWFYGGAAGFSKPSAVRYGPFKAHWATGPGLSGCKPAPSAPIGCPKKEYPDVPLLFNVEVDPSEAYALTDNNTMPNDPMLQGVVKTLQKAYELQVKRLVSHHSPPAPDEPGEGPGRYGVCCDRAKNCDCDGAPS
ncbi:MAG: hypothetical protein SGPRY_009006 [Prymnesium sp.]